MLEQISVILRQLAVSAGINPFLCLKEFIKTVNFKPIDNASPGK
jgi:hypothetical protein